MDFSRKFRKFSHSPRSAPEPPNKASQARPYTHQGILRSWKKYFCTHPILDECYLVILKTASQTCQIIYFSETASEISFMMNLLVDKTKLGDTRRNRNLDEALINLKEDFTVIIKKDFEEQAKKSNGSCIIFDTPVSCSKFEISDIKGCSFTLITNFLENQKCWDREEGLGGKEFSGFVLKYNLQAFFKSLKIEKFSPNFRKFHEGFVKLCKKIYLNEKLCSSKCPKPSRQILVTFQDVPLIFSCVPNFLQNAMGRPLLCIEIHPLSNSPSIFNRLNT